VPGDVSSVQAAVDQALPGDIVLVEPGSYFRRARQVAVDPFLTEIRSA